MRTLLISLPLRPRLAASAAAPSGPAAGPAEWSWVLKIGDSVESGRSPLSALPAADALVLVPHALQCSFHRVVLPRTAPSRWRAALAGLLEDHLLEDTDQLHLALEPGARVGEETWVCVTPRSVLADALTALEASERFVDRVAPAAWPTEQPCVTAFVHADTAPQALLTHADGVVCLPLVAWPSLRSQWPAPSRWAAETACAGAAEQAFGQAVQALSPELRSVQALDSEWNLLQFDLAPRVKGLNRLRLWGHRFLQPQWRRVRLGLVGLVAVNLIGLNAWAWQERQHVARQKAELTRTLTQTFPRVRAVADAPLQMQREMDLLRAQSGQLGDADLESLLGAAASAWPEDRGPTDALSFETGQLTWPAAGWTEAQIDLMRQRLNSTGWALTADQGRLTLKKARSTAP